MAFSFKSKFKLLVMAIVAATIFSVTACNDDNDYDSLPLEIQQFLTLYFPGDKIGEVIPYEGGYIVNLQNSATLTFNASNAWVKVDGNGNTLPSIFLFDQLPSQLYENIIITDNIAEVYSVSRKDGVYTVAFLNYTIAYDSATDEFTPVVT
jgi:hypothetical protein